MIIVEPSATIEAVTPEDPLVAIERAGRTCYLSEGKAAEGTAAAFVRKLIERGHESVLEHASMTVRFVVDRGVSHELVRHRLAAFSQESTRYCNYAADRFGHEITVIAPCFWRERDPLSAGNWHSWFRAMREAERAYFELLEQKATPQEARSVLPNSLKTELVVTANTREWRHIFRLRTAVAAHPQMRQVMRPLLEEARRRVPVLFDDVGEVAHG